MRVGQKRHHATSDAVALATTVRLTCLHLRKQETAELPFALDLGQMGDLSEHPPITLTRHTTPPSHAGTRVSHWHFGALSAQGY